jgi:serine/threonine-protein kinase
MPELTNQTVGPYRIEELLGQGGTGAVYRGVHLETGQDVAVKVMHHHLAGGPDFRKRFFIEAETLVKLTHANIIWSYDYDYTQVVEICTWPWNWLPAVP